MDLPSIPAACHLFGSEPSQSSGFEGLLTEDFRCPWPDCWAILFSAEFSYSTKGISILSVGQSNSSCRKEKNIIQKSWIYSCPLQQLETQSSTNLKVIITSYRSSILSLIIDSIIMTYWYWFIIHRFIIATVRRIVEAHDEKWRRSQIPLDFSGESPWL